jgi:hypothetical protein
MTRVDLSFVVAMGHLHVRSHTPLGQTWLLQQRDAHACLIVPYRPGLTLMASAHHAGLTVMGPDDATVQGRRGGDV